MTGPDLLVEVALQLSGSIKLLHAYVHAHALHIQVQYRYADRFVHHVLDLAPDERSRWQHNATRVHHSELPETLMAYGEPYMCIGRYGNGLPQHQHEYRKVHSSGLP